MQVKQAVPDNKGRACRTKEIGEQDRKVTRSDCATTHDRATTAGWVGLARATAVLLRPGFKRRIFMLLRGELASFS